MQLRQRLPQNQDCISRFDVGPDEVIALVLRADQLAQHGPLARRIAAERLVEFGTPALGLHRGCRRIRLKRPAPRRNPAAFLKHRRVGWRQIGKQRIGAAQDI